MHKLIKLLSKFLTVSLIAMSLTGCSSKDLVSLYYVNGTQEEFNESVKKLGSINPEIPAYYTDNYSVMLEIVSVTECTQSDSLTDYLIKVKFTTEDGKIGYAFDNWKLDNGKIVDYKSVWVDTV